MCVPMFVSNCRQVPPDWLFPLPVPGKRPPTALQAAAASASSQLHPAMAPLAPLAHAATALGGDGAGSTWLEPAVTTTHTVIRSCPQTPQQQGSHLATTAGTGSSLASQPLLSSPTSLLAALSLDQYIQQSPLDSPTGGSKHTTRPSTPAGGSSTASSSSSRSLNAAGVAREAAQQLLCGGPSSAQATFRAAGVLSNKRRGMDSILPGCVQCAVLQCVCVVPACADLHTHCCNLLQVAWEEGVS